MLKFLARYIVPLSIGIAIIVIVIGVKFLIIRIDIDKIGVKTSVWGVKRGVVQKTISPAGTGI
jgi:hypothetical protein